MWAAINVYSLMSCKMGLHHRRVLDSEKKNSEKQERAASVMGDQGSYYLKKVH